MTPSANDTRILWTSELGVVILDALAGESEMFNAYINVEDTPYKLSPNRKYVGWYLEDPVRVELWDMDDRVLLLKLPFSSHYGTFFFSDDSSKLIICYLVKGDEYVDIWDISAGDAIRNAIKITLSPSTFLPRLLSLNGNHLVFSDWHIARSLNLDVHQLISSLCEHHRNHSQFGMFPTDDCDTRQCVNINNIMLIFSLPSYSILRRIQILAD